MIKARQLATCDYQVAVVHSSVGPWINDKVTQRAIALIGYKDHIPLMSHVVLQYTSSGLLAASRRPFSRQIADRMDRRHRIIKTASYDTTL